MKVVHLTYNLSGHYTCTACNQRVSGVFKLKALGLFLCLECAEETNLVEYELGTPVIKGQADEI